MPVTPRFPVENTRLGIQQRVAQRTRAESLAHLLHFVPRAKRHHLHQETRRVSQRDFRWLPPDQPPRHLIQLFVWFHFKMPPHVSSSRNIGFKVKCGRRFPPSLCRLGYTTAEAL